MYTKPVLSAIIPNYNHANYIAEAIEALLAQSYDAKEIIIVDDASTDNSIEIIERYMHSSDSIRLLKNEVNLGVFKAFRKGLDVSTGEFIYAGAADDRLKPGLFEKSVALLSQYPQSNMCCANVEAIDGKGKHLFDLVNPEDTQNAFTPPEKIPELIKKGWQGLDLLGYSTIYRRVAFIEAGGSIGQLGFLHDIFLRYIIAFKSGFCYINEVLTSARFHSDEQYSEKMMRDFDQSFAFFSNFLYFLKNHKDSSIVPKEFITSRENMYARGLYSCMKHIFYVKQSALLDEMKRLKGANSPMDETIKGFVSILMKLERYLAYVYCNRNFARELKDSSCRLRDV